MRGERALWELARVLELRTLPGAPYGPWLKAQCFQCESPVNSFGECYRCMGVALASWISRMPM